MTDTNTLEPTDDLQKRCAEIIGWCRTGVLVGDALRSHAESKWPDDIHNLQMAERATENEALCFIAKWGAPALASSEPYAGTAAGPVGFDHKTAANFLNGKTVTDEEMRQFVAHSRWAHDDRDWLRNTIADLRREIAQRDAEIALLKTSLLDAESPTQAAQAQDPRFCYRSHPHEHQDTHCQLREVSAWLRWHASACTTPSADSMRLYADQVDAVTGSLLDTPAQAVPAPGAPSDDNALRCAVGNCMSSGEVAQHAPTCTATGATAARQSFCYCPRRNCSPARRNIMSELEKNYER